MTRYLVLDCDGLCHRSYHAMGGTNLSHGRIPTAVSFRFLGDIMIFQGKFQTQQVAFCFDSRKNKRKDISKVYKLKRTEAKKEWTEDEKLRYRLLCKQRRLLRKRYLPRIGFRNIFSQSGYEADDLIASICNNLRDQDEAVIVTSDKDMYQCLSKKVSIWRPREQQLWTRKLFKTVYGVKPRDWVQVKAIAGCNSDEVVGIKGIGEKSVCQYINGTLKGVKLDLLVAQRKKMLKRNLLLVDLPLKGCKKIKLKKDGTLKWGPVLDSLNIKSLNPDAGYMRRPTLSDIGDGHKRNEQD